MVWIDLIDSTSRKNKNNEWHETIPYFLNMTTVIFDSIGYKTLKYIGDEVMLFKQIDDHDKSTKRSEAKAIYDFIFDSQRWYFGELERFNPNPNEKYYVKICISYIKGAIELVHLNKNDKYFDILGKSVDFSARIKGLATKEFVVANEKYVKYLHGNKGKYSKCFEEYKWEDAFKGSRDKVTYYAERINQG